VAAKKSKKVRLAIPPPIDANESRAAVALTVAWMLTLLSTAAAMIVAVLAWSLMLAFPVAAGQGHPLASLPGTLTFVSAATGILCLILTYFVNRVRKSPAPRAITIAAVLIGAVPWATIAVLSFRG
jgi:hypothetical protein